MENQYYFVLDIGTTLTKLVAFSFTKKTLLTLHSSIMPTKGVDNGYIVDDDLLKEMIAEIFKSIPKDLELDGILLVLPSSDLKVYSNSITTKVDGVITSNMIENMRLDSLKIKIPETHEYIASYPVKFLVDDSYYYRPPIGIRASTISLNSTVVTSPKTIAHNYVRLIESVGVPIKDISINACTNIKTALYEQESKDGVFLIDIGGKTTSISLVQNDVIKVHKRIEIGSELITDLIMEKLKVDYITADELKVRFGNALPSKYNHPIYYYHESGDYLVENVLYDIVNEGLNNLFSQIKENLDLMYKENDYPLVFTGGGSHLINLDKKASLYFSRSVRIAKIKLLGIRHNSFASSVGALRDYMANKLNYYLEHSRIVGDESFDLVTKAIKSNVTTD